MKFNQLVEKYLTEDKINTEDYIYTSDEIDFLLKNQEDSLDDILPEDDPNKNEKKELLKRIFKEISNKFFKMIKNDLLLPKSKLQEVNESIYAKIIISNIFKEEMLHKLAIKVIKHFQDILTFDDHLDKSYWKAAFNKFETSSDKEDKFTKTFKENPLILKLAIYEDTKNKILNVFFILT